MACACKPTLLRVVHRLNNSKEGLNAIQTVMRMDISPTFMNGSATKVLTYFQPPELKDLGGGRYLQQIVSKIANPPIFWDAFVFAFKGGKLKSQLRFVLRGCCFSSSPYLVMKPPRTAQSRRTQW
jgi:hypothetical protein